MLCLACARPVPGPLCERCRTLLARAPERVVGDGIRVVAAFAHEGLARELVHGLKYRGVLGFAGVAAAALAPLMPPCPIVPVPRVLSRRMLYGVDPAVELARAVSAVTGAPVLRLLRAPLHAPRRAGRDHHRPPPRFRLTAAPPERLVLVDDVVTTGRTLAAAARVVGPEQVVMAVAATSARKPGV